MSKESVKQMFGKIEKDADMKKKYVGIMQEHQKKMEENLSDKLIELGKTAELEFSKDDLMAARAELIDNVNSNKELSDDDMANVVGGITQKQIGVITSVVGLGVTCAGMSIIIEVFNQSGCQSFFSGTDNNCNGQKLINYKRGE